MKITLGKSIAASIAFAGMIFLIMAVGSVYSIKQSEAAANWVAHTEEVEARLNGVLAQITGWESANRGYIITGDEVYLAPYQDAKTELDARLNNLDGLLADNPAQLANVKKLRGLLENKINAMQRSRQARAQGDLTSAVGAVASGEGLRAMNDIRTLLGQMRSQEDTLLAQRRNENNRQNTQSIAAAICTSAVGLAVLALATVIMIRQWQQRLAAEAALASKTAELQGILDNAPVGIFLKDLDSRYLLLNAPMRHLLGTDPAAALGKTPAELHPAERAAKILSEDRAVLADGRPHEIELELKCADGAIRAYHTHKFTLRDHRGKIYAIGGIAEEVTEQRQMDVTLRRALDAAEAASRTKSQFLANMSHELRTPLNSIIGFSEILSDKLFGTLNEKQQQYVGNILASGRHLLLLINDLLDLAKIEAGKMSLEPEQLQIAALMNDGANLVRGTAERKGVTLTVTPADLKLTARVDSARTKQIIYNLLSNAVKFTPQGGQVVLSAKKVVAPVCPEWGGPPRAAPGQPLPGEWVHLTIADSGVGIAPADIRRIFGEFEQADSTYAREQEGTGLGLTLTSKLANMHGGGVWAESAGRINRGSIFHVLLPLAGPPDENEQVGEVAQPAAKKSAALPAASPSLLTATARPGPNGRPLVLVVEDEVSASDLIKEYLTKGGYDVAHAATGEEALRLAAQLQPAAITLDIMLPDANGMDILAQLKAAQATNQIPVIVVSVTDERKMGLSLGATEFFVKPVSAERLIAALDRVRAAIQRDILRVLVVDDEPAAREGITAMLEPRGYQVLAAESGEAALRVISDHPPDVAIIDLTMPGMSGFELVTQLRQNPSTRELPICIYTAKDLSASEMHWLHQQSTVVTAKPFREQLLTELQRACANST